MEIEVSDDLKSFPVGDGATEIQIDRRWLDIDTDLIASGSDVAANIGKCADVLADRVQRLEMLEADFRAWKARKKMSALASDPKMAEWKVKDKYRTLKEYRDFYEAIAQCKGDLDWITAIQKALEIKARLVDTFARMDRGAEIATGKTGLSPGRKRGRVAPDSVSRDL